MKTCIELNCTNNQFGGGYCKYHQFKRHMRGGDLYKPKTKKQTPIKKKSKKRIVEEISYREMSQLIWDKAKETGNGEVLCFFCNKPMAHKEDTHHLKGRTGALYAMKRWLRNAHRYCHGERYHDARYEDLIKEKWYPGFLERLKEASEDLWRKELKKGDKAQRIIPYYLDTDE